jgi:hypothetical protein
VHGHTVYGYAGDAQSTDGSESSHMHNPWQEDYNTGYGACLPVTLNRFGVLFVVVYN